MQNATAKFEPFATTPFSRGLIPFIPSAEQVRRVEVDGEPLTQERQTVQFFRGPVTGPNAWRGRNRCSAEWVYDIFRIGDETIAVRVYKCTKYSTGESRLADGFRANTPERIAQARAEFEGFRKSEFCLLQGSGDREPCTSWNDLGM